MSLKEKTENRNATSPSKLALKSIAYVMSMFTQCWKFLLEIGDQRISQLKSLQVSHFLRFWHLLLFNQVITCILALTGVSSYVASENIIKIFPTDYALKEMSGRNDKAAVHVITIEHRGSRPKCNQQLIITLEIYPTLPQRKCDFSKRTSHSHEFEIILKVNIQIEALAMGTQGVHLNLFYRISHRIIQWVIHMMSWKLSKRLMVI